MTASALSVLENEYVVYQLYPSADIPEAVYKSRFYSITKTNDEISIVCEADIPIRSIKANPGWSCLQILGPLDFSLTGILAGISKVLADDDLSLLAISTFDTDYFLVKRRQLSKAISALKKAGYTFK
jgi:hypothetical protein